MTVPRVRPLLGDTRRTGAVITLAACVVVVAALGLLFKGQTGPDGFDNAIDSPVITLSRGHTGLLLWLVMPGGPIAMIAVSAAIAAGCLIARRPNGAVLAVIAVPAATGLVEGLLKHLFNRTYLGALAFPSGHTTSVMSVTAVLAILLGVPPRQARTRVVRVAIVAAACLISVVVVLGVIGLRFHYFTDTVAGAAVGVGTVLGLALLLDLATDALARRGAGSVSTLAQPLGERDRGRAGVVRLGDRPHHHDPGGARVEDGTEPAEADPADREPRPGGAERRHVREQPRPRSRPS
jgi:membrane-associated phospholipid phosphatase